MSAVVNGSTAIMVKWTGQAQKILYLPTLPTWQFSQPVDWGLDGLPNYPLYDTVILGYTFTRHTSMYELYTVPRAQLTEWWLPCPQLIQNADNSIRWAWVTGLLLKPADPITQRDKMDWTASSWRIVQARLS